MWFVLGLATLVVAAALMARWRWHSRWRGERRGAGYFKLGKNKGRIVSLRIGIDAPLALDFELKREGWFDRAAKSIGVSVELQVNRRGFDELVYILADDERLVRALRNDSALLALFEGIAGAKVEGLRFHRLVSRQGQLWIELTPDGTPGDIPSAVDWALPALQAVAAALPAARPGQQPVFDRQFLRAVVLVGICGGLVVNGLVQLLRIAFGSVPFTLDTGQLLLLATGTAAALLLLLALATLVLLGRSSRAHLVLLEVLLVGGLGAFVTAYVELRDLNMEADGSPVQVYQSQVLHKHVTISRNRSGSTSHSYYLELADWNGGAGAVDVQVTSSEYDMHVLGQQMEVRQHAGFLGVRWVESIGDIR